MFQMSPHEFMTQVIRSCWLTLLWPVILKGFLLKVPPCLMPTPHRKRRLSLPHVNAPADKRQQTATKSRTLSLTVPLAPTPKSSPARRRTLDQEFVTGRLKDGKVKPLCLPKSEKELAVLLDKKKFEVEYQEESDSDSTSSEVKEEQGGGCSRTLRSRPKRQLQKKVDLLMSGSVHGKSILETAAISARARENYTRKWEELSKLARSKGVSLDNAEALDSMLVELFDQKFLEGEGAHYGDYMLASLMDMKPAYSRMGDKKIPRAWRSLRGWRKLCPSRSRLAYPLAVWAALSWRMVVHGHLSKAVFNLLQVSSYHRPGTLLKLRKLGLVKPTAGVTTHWSILTSLSETSDVSKVGTKDDSVMLDSEWIQFITPLLSVLARGRPMDRVWDFTYGEYLAVFNRCASELKINVVPYQARHSGPSIDRAAKTRDLDEVRKRGGWMTRQSVMRYEKAGRLAATWQKLDANIQTSCKSAERYLEDIMLGHNYPDIPLPS